MLLVSIDVEHRPKFCTNPQFQVNTLLFFICFHNTCNSLVYRT